MRSAARWTSGALLGLFCAAVASCAASPAGPLSELYEENRSDLGGGSEADQAEAEGRRAARIAKVRAILERETELSSEDMLLAAAVLLDAAELSDLALAEALALEAAVTGDDRGFPLAAEAIDRQCVLLGMPQRYGTQYFQAPGSGSWALYPADPATSDAERRAMGLPTLAEAKLRAAEIE